MSFWTDDQVALMGTALGFVRDRVVPHLQEWEELGGGSDVANPRTTAVDAP